MSRESIDIRLSREGDMRLFRQARDTLESYSPSKLSDPTHVQVARYSLKTFTNGEAPPVRRFLTSGRVTSLRAELAEDLDADPLDISPLAAMQDALAHRLGATNSLTFLPPTYDDLAGFERAARSVDTDDPTDALETILSRYNSALDALDELPEECGHLEDYKVDMGTDGEFCMRCRDEEHRQDDRQIAEGTTGFRRSA